MKKKKEFLIAIGTVIIFGVILFGIEHIIQTGLLFWLVPTIFIAVLVYFFHKNASS